MKRSDFLDPSTGNVFYNSSQAQRKITDLKMVRCLRPFVIDPSQSATMLAGSAERDGRTTMILENGGPLSIWKKQFSFPSTVAPYHSVIVCSRDW